MIDNQQNNSQPEINESVSANFEDSSAGRLADESRASTNDLYFLAGAKQDTSNLPSFEIAGLGPEFPPGSPAARAAANLDNAGMEYKSSDAQAHTYGPKDGRTDAYGRTKVTEYAFSDGQIYAEDTVYADKSRTFKTFEEGKLASTTKVSADGKQVTSYPDIKGDAETMKTSFDKDGLDGLKKEVEKILKDADGNWSKISTIMKQAEQLGLPIYKDGDNFNFNDSSIPYCDTVAVSKPQEPQEQPAPAPAPQEEESLVPFWRIAPYLKG